MIVISSVNGTRVFRQCRGHRLQRQQGRQVALAKMAAVELAEDRIRVNVVCPGSIDTEIDENTEERNTGDVGRRIEYPEGQIPLTGDQPGTSGQVAELVCFLASDAASHITGTEIWIDGGRSLLIGWWAEPPSQGRPSAHGTAGEQRPPRSKRDDPEVMDRPKTSGPGDWIPHPGEDLPPPSSTIFMGLAPLWLRLCSTSLSDPYACSDHQRTNSLPINTHPPSDSAKSHSLPIQPHRLCPLVHIKPRATTQHVPTTKVSSHRRTVNPIPLSKLTDPDTSSVVGHQATDLAGREESLSLFDFAGDRPTSVRS